MKGSTPITWFACLALVFSGFVGQASGQSRSDLSGDREETKRRAGGRNDLAAIEAADPETLSDEELEAARKSADPFNKIPYYKRKPSQSKNNAPPPAPAANNCPKVGDITYIQCPTRGVSAAADEDDPTSSQRRSQGDSFEFVCCDARWGCNPAGGCAAGKQPPKQPAPRPRSERDKPQAMTGKRGALDEQPDTVMKTMRILEDMPAAAARGFEEAATKAQTDDIKRMEEQILAGDISAAKASLHLACLSFNWLGAGIHGAYEKCIKESRAEFFGEVCGFNDEELDAYLRKSDTIDTLDTIAMTAVGCIPAAAGGGSGAVVKSLGTTSIFATFALISETLKNPDISTVKFLNEYIQRQMAYKLMPNKHPLARCFNELADKADNITDLEEVMRKALLGDERMQELTKEGEELEETLKRADKKIKERDPEYYKWQKGLLEGPPPPSPSRLDAGRRIAYQKAIERLKEIDEEMERRVLSLLVDFASACADSMTADGSAN
jgi:hypothetical protein